MRATANDNERTNFIRRQTLKSSERYLTTYLAELRERTQQAQECCEHAAERACAEAYEQFETFATNYLHLATKI